MIHPKYNLISREERLLLAQNTVICRVKKTMEGRGHYNKYVSVIKMVFSKIKPYEKFVICYFVIVLNLITCQLCPHNFKKTFSSNMSRQPIVSPLYIYGTSLVELFYFAFCFLDCFVFCCFGSSGTFEHHKKLKESRKMQIYIVIEIRL